MLTLCTMRSIWSACRPPVPQFCAKLCYTSILFWLGCSQSPGTPSVSLPLSSISFLLLLLSQGNATLIGRPADPELSAPGCQYVLGIYDKEDGTLQVRKAAALNS